MHKNICRVSGYIHILQHAILPLFEERAELSAKAIGPSSVEGTLAEPSSEEVPGRFTGNSAGKVMEDCGQVRKRLLFF